MEIDVVKLIVFPRKMGGDTRPLPVLCVLDKSGSNGIERNVAQRVVGRVVSVLQENSGASVFTLGDVVALAGDNNSR